MDEFLEELAMILEEDSVNADSMLKDFSSWDSLAVLSIISMIDEKYNKNLNALQINECATPKQLFDLISP